MHAILGSNNEQKAAKLVLQTLVKSKNQFGQIFTLLLESGSLTENINTPLHYLSAFCSMLDDGLIGDTTILPRAHVVDISGDKVPAEVFGNMNQCILKMFCRLLLRGLAIPKEITENNVKEFYIRFQDTLGIDIRKGIQEHLDFFSLIKYNLEQIFINQMNRDNDKKAVDMNNHGILNLNNNQHNLIDPYGQVIQLFGEITDFIFQFQENQRTIIERVTGLSFSSSLDQMLGISPDDQSVIMKQFDMAQILLSPDLILYHFESQASHALTTLKLKYEDWQQEQERKKIQETIYKTGLLERSRAADFVLDKNEEQITMDMHNPLKKSPFYAIGVDPRTVNAMNIVKIKKLILSILHPDKAATSDGARARATLAFQIASQKLAMCEHMINNHEQQYMPAGPHPPYYHLLPRYDSDDKENIPPINNLAKQKIVQPTLNINIEFSIYLEQTHLPQIFTKIKIPTEITQVKHIAVALHRPMHRKPTCLLPKPEHLSSVTTLSGPFNKNEIITIKAPTVQPFVIGDEKEYYVGVQVVSASNDASLISWQRTLIRIPNLNALNLELLKDLANTFVGAPFDTSVLTKAGPTDKAHAYFDILCTLMHNARKWAANC